MSATAIEVSGFTKRYGRRLAVDDLTLDVPAGSVFGLLGCNGAGKTTTIRALLGLVRPTRGRLRVLGLDCSTRAVDVRRRVGYVPEAFEAYRWMTVDEVLRFAARFYPGWDRGLATRLIDELELPRDRRLEALSRGMQAKVALVGALAPRPAVLILDDPTSGLDPVVRREFLEATIRHVQGEGGTVFFSTHLLHELERIADEVGILHQGRLRLRASPDALKQSHKKLRAIYSDRVPETFPLKGLLRVERNGRQAVLTVSRYDSGQEIRLRQAGAREVQVIDLSLEEIFVEHARAFGGAS